ncbi:hypothetical protein BgiMline_028418 [Biomphalaria glabrata]|nr:hypothetical protein BgiBS90_032542 [Biomphalaria glabrata]
MEERELDLSVWVNISPECPLNSDEESRDSSPKGCLTIADNHDNGDEADDNGHQVVAEDKMDETADELLQRLAGRHDDFLSTVDPPVMEGAYNIHLS